MRRIALLCLAVVLAGLFLLNPFLGPVDSRWSRDLSRAQAVKAAITTYAVEHKGKLPNSWRDMQYLIGKDFLTELESRYGFGVSLQATPLLEAGKPFLLERVLISENERDVEGRYVFYTSPDGSLHSRFLDRKQSKQLFEETGFRYVASGAGETGTIALTPDPVDYWADAKESPLFLPAICVLSVVLLSSASAIWYFWISKVTKA